MYIWKKKSILMLWQSANISLQWEIIDIIISSKWHITQEIVINHQNESDRGNRLDQISIINTYTVRWRVKMSFLVRQLSRHFAPLGKKMTNTCPVRTACNKIGIHRHREQTVCKIRILVYKSGMQKDVYLSRYLEVLSTTRKFTFNMSSTNDLAHSLLSMYIWILKHKTKLP